MALQPTAFLQGTRNPLILRSLLSGQLLSRRIRPITAGTFHPNSLFPALYGMDDSIPAFWGGSENSGRAKYYRLTRASEKQLAAEIEHWGGTCWGMARSLDVC